MWYKLNSTQMIANFQHPNSSVQGGIETLIQTLSLEWHTHFITPIFKAGDRTSFKNYRPISLLCTISKVLEHCLDLYEVDYGVKLWDGYWNFKITATRLPPFHLNSHQLKFPLIERKFVLFLVCCFVFIPFACSLDLDIVCVVLRLLSMKA